MRAHHDDTTRMRAGKLEHAGSEPQGASSSLSARWCRWHTVRRSSSGNPAPPPAPPTADSTVYETPSPIITIGGMRSGHDVHEQQRTLIGVRQVDRIGKGAFGQLAPIQREDDLRVGQGEQVPRAGVWQAPRPDQQG